MSDGLWRGVVAPYRMLDPGLYGAEALLSTTLADVCSATYRAVPLTSVDFDN